MRVGLFGLLTAVLGILTGLGLTWWEFRGDAEYFQPVSLTKPAVNAKSSVQLPTPRTGPIAVVVGDSKFDFGTMNHDQTRDKTFVIRNEGTEPLTISWGGETCGKCISNNHGFSTKTIAPGNTAEVIVTYATKKLESNFSESAYIATNDPRNSTLQLQIVGFVTLAVKSTPESLVVSSIPTSEPTTVTANLFGFHSEKIELMKHEFSNPALGSLMELTTKPLDEATVKAEKHALAGLQLQLVLKPGLPIGPLSQTISLTVMTDREHSVSLPVSGTVVGDMSLYGRNYDSDNGNFNIGVVNRDTGMAGELFVLVKGPQRKEVQLSVGEVDPAGVLQVSVGEPTPLTDGKAIKFPIQVKIPPGSPVMNRLGNKQGKAGTIKLNTTHPVSKELPINVRFAIE